MHAVAWQTTYENFRNRFDKKGNPFNRGVPYNLMEVLCSRIPPSKNHFRAEVTDASNESSKDGDASGSPAVESGDVLVDVKRAELETEREVANGLLTAQKNGTLLVAKSLSDKGDDPLAEAFSDMHGDSTPRSRRQLARGTSDNSNSDMKNPLGTFTSPGKNGHEQRDNKIHEAVEATRLKEEG